mmetsp:Transcript_60043/g.178258  ORF Transcript_60043/g.178258 Transcript_60043/m.178258 type:complete len:100 (-) Transcript_60043:73-372(-)
MPSFPAPCRPFALQEAGSNFQPRTLAAELRKSEPPFSENLALANALDAVSSPLRSTDSEGQCYLTYDDGAVANSVDAAPGVRVDLLASGNVAGVCLYQE